MGENLAGVSSSEFVRNLHGKGLEVLYMIDPLDEHVVQHLREFDGKLLKSQKHVDQERELEVLKPEFELLTAFMKDVLGDVVEKVLVSDRIDDSACIISTSEQGWTASMDRILRTQASRDDSISEASSYYRYIKHCNRDVWVNPKHPTIRESKEKIASQRLYNEMTDFIWLLFDVSCHNMMGRNYVDLSF